MSNLKDFRALAKGREMMYLYLARLFRKEPDAAYMAQLAGVKLGGGDSDVKVIDAYLKARADFDGYFDGEVESDEKLAVDFAKVFIGAGLAGSEAAYQLANRGIKVKLYEMKPVKKSPAHKSDGFAELVCSNSLRSNDPKNAVGLLKQEMIALDSLIMKAALKTEIPAGSSLAVDREAFSRFITEELINNPNIEIIHEEVTDIDTDQGNELDLGVRQKHPLDLRFTVPVR